MDVFSWVRTEEVNIYFVPPFTRPSDDIPIGDVAINESVVVKDIIGRAFRDDYFPPPIVMRIVAFGRNTYRAFLCLEWRVLTDTEFFWCVHTGVGANFQAIRLRAYKYIVIELEFGVGRV